MLRLRFRLSGQRARINGYYWNNWWINQSCIKISFSMSCVCSTTKHVSRYFSRRCNKNPACQNVDIFSSDGWHCRLHVLDQSTQNRRTDHERTDFSAEKNLVHSDFRDIAMFFFSFTFLKKPCNFIYIGNWDSEAEDVFTPLLIILSFSKYLALVRQYIYSRAERFRFSI